MKKLFCFCIILALTAAGCDKDDRFLRTETLTIASELRLVHGGVETYYSLFVKNSGETRWNPLYQSIEGFEFEEGYECVVKVNVFKIKYTHTVMDAPTIKYVLVKVVSKIKKDSEGLPEDVPPLPEI